MGNASSFSKGIQAKRVSFNDPCAELSVPQSAKPGLFSGEPASFFTGVVAGTVRRCWIGNGGRRRWGPGVQSSSDAASLQKVSAPVLPGETDSDGILLASAGASGAEIKSGGAQFGFPGVEKEPSGTLEVSAAENDLNGAQIRGAAFAGHRPRAGHRQGRHDVLDTTVGRAAGFGRLGRHDVLDTSVGRAAGFGRLGRHDVLGTAVGRVAGHPAVGRAPGMGRRAKRSQVRLERTEAGSLDSFDDAFLSCRTESPSSRVSRVTSALHNLCSVHSSSFPAHNSHARMADARCVVNSVGDTEDGGRLSCVYGGTKSLSTCTRTGVRRPAVEKLASPQQASLNLHDETWAGLLKNQGPRIFREVEIIPGCAVRVACPSCPDYYPEPPGPGIVIRNMLGWSKLEKTERSGVWVFRGALQGENLFSLLDAAGDWVTKGSYHTAWAVPGNSSCSCSYAYGHGPAVGPHTGERCWPLLAGLWRAIAPLMKPWCAEGDVPTAANLNLYRGWKSCVGWHCDDEPLFGKCGDAKLIVSVSLGNFALFRWRRQSCSSNEDSSCRLDHGDILVMDGQCQDEFLHRTSPGREQDRINITFRWVKQHVASCPLFKAGVACCLPTCAQGSSVSVMGNVSGGVFWVFGFLLGVLCIWGVLFFLVSLLCTRLGLLRCASYRTRPFGSVRLGLYLCNLWEEYLKIHKVANMYFGSFFGYFYLEAVYASLSGTAQSPWLLCMYGLLGSGGTSEKLQANTK